MKVVVLCGGLGTRLREETEFRPKPMVEIGGRPILWHIMKVYAHSGFREFVLCLGYRGNMIKDYFLNYDLLNTDFTLQLGSKSVERLNVVHDESDWRITFVDTGQETMTGGRLKRLQPYLRDEERFLLTYGDDPNRNFVRSAEYVDKILRGSKPGDLPVEQPTTFELVINLKTAKELGLTVPPALLALATEVIE